MFDDPCSRFLRWGFGAEAKRVLVASFKEDPAVAAGSAWSVWPVAALVNRGSWPPRSDCNNYFCVSLFKGGRRQEAFWDGLYVWGIDDVGVKVDPGRLLMQLGAPGCAIETSRGNYQWFYRLSPPVRDVGKAKQLVGLVGNDARDLTRLMRLPVGTNTKPSAGNFSTRVTSQVSGAGVLETDQVLTSWDVRDAAGDGRSTTVGGSATAGRLSTRVGTSVADLIGEDRVGKRLLELGRVKGMIPSRLGIEILCPWEGEHTIKTDTGAAYFPDTGGFECHHGHCQAAGRDGRALKDWLDTSGLWDDDKFDKVDDVDPKVDRPYRDVLLDQYVFVETEGAYLDLLADEVIGIAAFNDARREKMRSWLEYTITTNGKTTVKTMPTHSWFLQNRGRVATRMVYWPGRGTFFRDADGVPVVNRYRPAPRPLRGKGVVNEAMVGVWVGLVRDLCANEGPEVADRVLDLFALIVGEPEVKPGWGLLLQSEVHGLGKDLVLVPVIRAVGEANYAAPSLSEITEKYNPYAAKRLVVVSDPERNTRGAMTMRDFYTTIKPLTQNAAATVDIRDLGRKYRARNLSAWIITANPDNAMPLDESDRRFLVVMSTMPRKPDQFYVALVDWQKANPDLVGEFLHQRCETMPAARRAVLLGNAPSTSGKAVMIRLGEDHFTAHVRNQIETGRWDNLMTSDDIQGRLEQDARAGMIGRPIPSANRVGRVLKHVGADKVYNGAAVLVGGRRTHMWATRGPAKYVGWSMKDLVETYEKDRGSFTPVFATV